MHSVSHTQNPAVHRNSRTIEYVNQLWNSYLLLIVSLSILDLDRKWRRGKTTHGNQHRINLKESAMLDAWILMNTI